MFKLAAIDFETKLYSQSIMSSFFFFISPALPSQFAPASCQLQGAGEADWAGAPPTEAAGPTQG